MNARRDTHLFPSVLTAGFGGFLVWKGLEMPHPRGWSSSPGLFPIIIGAVLLVLALLLMVERNKQNARPSDSSHGAPATIDLRLIGLVCGSLAAYIMALRYFPFEPVTFVYLLMAMVFLGNRSVAATLMAAFGFTAVISVLFTKVLGTLLPGTYSLMELLP